jgi:hypothetical protein
VVGRGGKLAYIRAYYCFDIVLGHVKKHLVLGLIFYVQGDVGHL